MPAVISSSHDQAQSEVPSSTPQMETQQPMYAVAFQEQQPERTPSNQQQDQGNATFECMQTVMINVAEPQVNCTDVFCYTNENLVCQ